MVVERDQDIAAWSWPKRTIKMVVIDNAPLGRNELNIRQTCPVVDGEIGLQLSAAKFDIIVAIRGRAEFIPKSMRRSSPILIGLAWFACRANCRGGNGRAYAGNQDARIK